MFRFVLLIPVLSLGALSARVRAQSFDSTFALMDVLVINEGPNNLQLKGWAPTDLVMRAWRENFNAHGFYYYTFYVQHPDSEDGRTRWELVPFVTANRFANGIATSQGADCVLRDLRVVRPKQPPNPVRVLIADREMKGTYADSEHVTFSFYELRTNTRGMPGEPGIAFYRVRTIPARRRYCDVHDAFATELGIK
jgi:hypothetical protein